jgi:hypothetical protein
MQPLAVRLSFLPHGEAKLKAQRVIQRIQAVQSASRRFRLEYQLNTDRPLTITFSIAMPGSDFSVYTKGTARRK